MKDKKNRVTDVQTKVTRFYNPATDYSIILPVQEPELRVLRELPDQPEPELRVLRELPDQPEPELRELREPQELPL